MSRTVLITGGAGFIGCNAARAFVESGDRVLVLDNLARKGAEANLEWLRTVGEFEFIHGDVRDAERLEEVFRRRPVDLVLHLAAQVAVTTSVVNPREDFDVNAVGSFNLLEAIRASGQNPVILYASTNKVYGGMEEVAIVEKDGCYAYREFLDGIPESWPLDFHSPYGCSKGAADQYFLDYARIYGLRTVVFRQSCIYGYRQFGVEDQGWVAWFVIAAALGRPITIYGDGKQVRDVLFIDDLIDAMCLAVERIGVVRGQAYNIGGGPENVLSLLELLGLLEKRLGHPISHAFADWRPGDQRVFVCDISKARREFGWTPRIGAYEGVDRLCQWVDEHRDLFV